MNDPYRDSCAHDPGVFLDDERESMRRVGWSFAIAGVLALGAAALGLPWSGDAAAVELLLYVGAPAVFGSLMLLAGRSLLRLPGGSRDFAAADRTLTLLRVVVVAKGLVAVVLGAPVMYVVGPDLFSRLLDPVWTGALRGPVRILGVAVVVAGLAALVRRSPPDGPPPEDDGQ